MRTRSVKVPPTSTPSRYPLSFLMISLQRPPPGAHHHPLAVPSTPRGQREDLSPRSPPLIEWSHPPALRLARYHQSSAVSGTIRSVVLPLQCHVRHDLPGHAPAADQVVSHHTHDD